MSRSPSLKDVATAAEVDPSTASFVINGKGDKLRISPSTQARIMAAARQLGYRPNTIARDVALGRGVTPVITSDASPGSATPRERQIGLVLSAASPGETLALIPSLEPPLSAAGYQLVVVTLPADQAAARERVLRGGFAGLLCCRTVYSTVSALIAGACPTTVLWEGAGKAILNAVSPSPTGASVEASGQSAVSSPQPPVQPEPIPPPKPVVVTPVATPKPVIVAPTSISTSAPVPVVEPTGITPVTVAVPAADTAATTEDNATPVLTAEERAAPVVTGVSPVEASDQSAIPEPSPVLVDPEPASSPLSPDVSVPTPATPELDPNPVTAAVTPAPVVTATPTPEPVAPPPEPIAAPPLVVEPPPAPVIPVEPPPTIPAPAPVEVAPLPASPVAEELPAALPATADEAPISTDLPLTEADSQAAGSPDKQELPTS